MAEHLGCGFRQGISLKHLPSLTSSLVTRCFAARAAQSWLEPIPRQVNSAWYLCDPCHTDFDRCDRRNLMSCYPDARDEV